MKLLTDGLHVCWIQMFAIIAVKNAVSITINGPKYVKIGDPIVVNCSSDITPIGKSAEFLINNKSYTNLVIETDGCYSGIMGHYCTPDKCQCSNNGRMFRLLIAPITTENVINISCVMKFADVTGFIHEEDHIIVQYIDVKGPFITTASEQPLTAGTIAHLKCNLVSPIRNFSVTWDCFGSKVQQQYRVNETILVSKAIIDVRSNYRGKHCSCLATTGNFMLSKTITLDVVNLPILKVVGERECNMTSLFLLSCLLSGDVKQYGFNDWIHTVNATFIRRLTGKRHKNTSALIIKSCNYQDAGEYSCTAWNRYSAGIFSTNISATVSINGPPTIIDINIYKDIETTISVSVYSSSPIFKFEWLGNGESVKNKSNLYTSSSEDNIFINTYGIFVQRLGCVYNLTIKDNTPGLYEIQLLNTFGITRRHITIHARGKDFDLGTVTWLLVVISVFFLMCLVAILSSNRGNPAGSFNWHPCIERKIYFAAPPPAEVTMQTYDTTNPHYAEIIPDDDYEMPDPVRDADTNNEDVNPYITPIY